MIYKIYYTDSCENQMVATIAAPYTDKALEILKEMVKSIYMKIETIKKIEISNFSGIISIDKDE